MQFSLILSLSLILISLFCIFVFSANLSCESNSCCQQRRPREQQRVTLHRFCNFVALTESKKAPVVIYRLPVSACLSSNLIRTNKLTKTTTFNDISSNYNDYKNNYSVSEDGHNTVYVRENITFSVGRCDKYAAWYFMIFHISVILNCTHAYMNVSIHTCIHMYI